ncbi:uncharacterized protein N7483_011434 [Penicillium malachiteum]|uniref:uncharacterized protein n=1 Tax=Penicillium malachiteum TaxID=1324776 RepID=UPI002547A474|nr:uncharacterized protein N7483_011434 [Penicillium malachiteum]KAJ5714253.1 hypothetical protein N7483_011434 [Penicillium malachiteum]
MPDEEKTVDFDDEPQESGVLTVNNTPSQQTATEATLAAPPKPPRPLSPKQHAENTLTEAFPTIDTSVVKAVLTASNWNVERAFNALLGMTDPTAQEDMVPPPKPPRPTQRQATSTTQRQMESDEMYARQLAEHYNSRRGPFQEWQNDPRYNQSRGRQEEEEEKEYSFFDDDLPVIRENLRKGFLETQSKVNSWVTNFKKRLDGDDLDEEPNQDREQQAAYGRPRRSGDTSRRSGDRERYDADPQVLGDDFSALELRDSEGITCPFSRSALYPTNTTSAPPPRPPRPLANTDFKKTSSPSPDRRKVSFQDGPPTEIDTGRNVPSGSKSSKWQPLATVDPSPVAENDPFSLGDSDDEKETKPKEQPTVAESDQLKNATAEAMSAEIGSKEKDDKAESSK